MRDADQFKTCMCEELEQWPQTSSRLLFNFSTLEYGNSSTSAYSDRWYIGSPDIGRRNCWPGA
jgi:hypothetical protein